MKEATKHFHDIFKGIAKKFKKPLRHFIVLNLEVLNFLYKIYANSISKVSFKDFAKYFERNRIFSQCHSLLVRDKINWNRIFRKPLFTESLARSQNENGDQEIESERNLSKKPS